MNNDVDESKAVGAAAADTSTSSMIPQQQQLPENRFELELEFVQALASPAYLHYLATTTNDDGESLLLDADFRRFLMYLQTTWACDPEYTKFITYPHSLYFLDLLITSESFCREMMNVQFRNFCHQQQFYAWQNRFSTLYGIGGVDGNSGAGDGDAKVLGKSRIDDGNSNQNGSGEAEAEQQDDGDEEDDDVGMDVGVGKDPSAAAAAPKE